MTRAQLEEAHREAHCVYCIIGLLKEKADAEDDACLEGTLEAAEVMMDDVVSALITLVAEAKAAEAVAVQQ